MRWSTAESAKMVLPKYCFKCGKELVFITETTNVFDLETGRRLVWFSVRCPAKAKGWWIFQDGHTASREPYPTCEPDAE